MKKNIIASSLIEVLVIMTIITTGVIGVYKIFGSSQKLSNTTSLRIQAIQIAREGIEAMTNIRDTNWLKFSVDRKNCWNVEDYKNNCIGNSTVANGSTTNNTAISPGSYIIYQGTDGTWKLTKKTGTGTGFDSNYRTDFEVKKDANGFYTQNCTASTPPSTPSTCTDLKPTFTREIKIKYIASASTSASTSASATPKSNAEKMKVSSIVKWADNTKSGAHTVTLETTLTNWEN